MRKRIAIAITHTFVARNYIQSGLTDALERALDADVEFVSALESSELAPGGARVYPHHHVPEPKDGRIPGVPRWLQVISGLRRRLFALEVPNSGVVHAKMRANLLNRGALRRMLVTIATGIIHVVAPRQSAVRNVVRRVIEALAARGVEPSPIFADGRCALAIVGSPGHFPLDALIAWQARKAGVATLCLMSSWDNMITKGPLIARVDRIAVWNAEMQVQARELHGYPLERTPAVGALQFAIYGTPRDLAAEAATLRDMGLQAGGYLLYLGSQRAPEYEVEDAAALARALRGSRFGHLQLVVRNHPQTDPTLYEPLAKEGIVLDRPPRWSPNAGDLLTFDRRAMEHMRTLLASAAAVVASWGTTALLEAAIVDRPILQLAWMDALPRSRPDQAATMRSLKNYAHVQSFNKSGALAFSRSPSDVAQCLARVMEQDAEFRAGRRRALARLTVQPYGEVIDRVIADCERFLGTRRAVAREALV